MIAKNHYDDCPYGCNAKGMLLDTNTGKFVQCPHCLKKKKEMLAMGYVEDDNSEQVNIQDAIGIRSEYLSTKFVYEAVIPDGEKVFIDEESMKWQKEEADKLYLGLTVGDLPEENLCFGLSVKGRVDRFVYPMIAKAYLSSISVGKFTSCSEFYRMRLRNDKDLDGLMTSDLVFMLIDDGVNFAEVSAAKGLMQNRGISGKPTIFVTTWDIESCSGLLGEGSMMLAKPIFTRYKKGKKHSTYINGLLGMENRSVDSSRQNGTLLADLDL